MEKDKVYDLEIIDNGSSFEGIAKKDGQVIFVPGSIIGENISSKIIKVNKNYCIGKIEEILSPSRFRVEPFCEVYKRCGGCSAQHIEYNMQLTLKTKNIQNMLKKQNVTYEKVEGTIGMGMPYYYRNKVQYPVRINKNGDTKIGFYSKKSHDIVENVCCYIQNRVIDILSKEVLENLVNNSFTGYNEEEKQGDIRHILIRRGYHTKEIMIVIIINANEESKLLFDKRFLEIAKNLMSKNNNIKSFYINCNDSDTNEILGEKSKLIFGEKMIFDYIGEYKYAISPKSFFQVNTLQAEVLYSNLREKLNLKGNEILFDLYSGVGSIGIFLSKNVKEVYGIEIEKQAVEMANINIKENNVKNAEYIAGSVEEKILEFKARNIYPDVIVVDPPRKGLELKSIEYILEFEPKKIGYVSCSPTTLARDLKLLESKYNIEQILPVDMFPQTSHVECVVGLSLK
ncbi:MAG: 23S rRNA (uracil(1939)-C(5))-methyltransferase RlmD [Clostridia bacterium]